MMLAKSVKPDSTQYKKVLLMLQKVLRKYHYTKLQELAEKFLG